MGELERKIDTLRGHLEREMSPELRLAKLDALRVLLTEVDGVESDTVAREVVRFGSAALKADEIDKASTLPIVKRNYVHLGPRDFHAYLMGLEWEREPKNQFYVPRMSVMRPVVDELTRLMETDELDLLSLSMPPGVGKSTLGLLFLSWVIGRDPMRPNLASGYSDKITKSFYVGVLGVTTDPEYTFTEIFPHAHLIATNAKDEWLDFRDDERQVVKRFPSLTCRSIDGSLTGATRCESILYCDDLVSGIEEALNRDRLEALWSKYGTDLKTRKKKKCKELHIGTRWSLHDPIGKLESQNAANPRARFIRLPAIDENGHSHFDYLHDVGFDDAYFAEAKETVDDVSWLCVYQQEPIEREGLLFPESDLKRVFQLPAEVPDERFAFVDVAFGGADSLSMPIIYRWGDLGIIVDWVFIARADYKITEPVVTGKIVSHRLHRVKFEANSGGDFYGRDVADMVAEKGHKCLITSERAPSTSNKMSRIVQHSPAIKAYHFWDREHYPSDDYRRAMVELCTFTQLGKNEHDDSPDSLAGLAAMERSAMSAAVRTHDRRAVGL